MKTILSEDETIDRDEKVAKLKAGVKAEKLTKAKDVVELAKKHGKGNNKIRHAKFIGSSILRDVDQNPP